MSSPAAAAIAFVALGALLSGAVLLLLFNPRSRGVRWWVVFQAVQMVWLGAQGWSLAAGSEEPAGLIVDGAVHFLPALFLAFGLAQLAPGLAHPNRMAWAMVILSALTLPLGLGIVGFGWFVPAWHLVLWSAGSLVLLRWNRATRGDLVAAENRPRSMLTLLLVGVGPLALLGYLTLGSGMWIYAMPVLVVWMQFLVFVGIARHRFYDIEIRLRRSGEMATAAAEQARLILVGEIGASLAHEIRNPLTGVRSLAQRLAEDEVEPGSRRRYAGIILDEVARVERLVSDLLALSRRAPRRVAAAGRVSIDALFDDLSLLLSSRAARAGTRLEMDGRGIEIHAAREPLAQILLNLALNAIDQSPPGTVVTLAARRSGGEVAISVRDRGAGVALEDRARIWEPFHSATGGTGLGLAVVRRLAREHGWMVQVDDAPGGGAEFLVRIPPRAAAPEAAEALAG